MVRDITARAAITAVTYFQVCIKLTCSTTVKGRSSQKITGLCQLRCQWIKLTRQAFCQDYSINSPRSIHMVVATSTVVQHSNVCPSFIHRTQQIHTKESIPQYNNIIHLYHSLEILPRRTWDITRPTSRSHRKNPYQQASRDKYHPGSVFMERCSVLKCCQIASGACDGLNPKVYGHPRPWSKAKLVNEAGWKVSWADWVQAVPWLLSGPPLLHSA